MNHPTLKFIQDIPLYEKEKPYNLSFGTYNEGVASNVHNENKGIRLHDVRTCPREFSYDENGFKLRVLPELPRLDGTQQTSIQFLESVRSFLLAEFKAERVVCYDFRERDTTFPRDQDDNRGDQYFGKANHQVPAPAVFTCHIDHTKEGGFHRMERHLTDEELAAYVAAGWRARIVNVWKPEETVVHAPLALCDLQTLDESDLLATDQINAKYQGEIYSVKYNQNQEFYFISNQQPDEVWVMVSFDSFNGQASEHVKGCAHGAIQLPDHDQTSSLGRKSVEVRAIVLNRVG